MPPPLQLRPVALPARAGVVLFELPDRLLTRFTGDLRRLGRPAVGVRLLDDPPGRAWVTVADPPAGLLLRTAEPDSAVEAFAEAAAGVWVTLGWDLPQADALRPAGGCVLVRPPGAAAVHAVGPPPVAPGWYAVGIDVPPSDSSLVSVVVDVRLTLRPAGPTAAERLWVWPGSAADEFREWCRTADEPQLRRLELAVVGSGGSGRLLVRPAGNRGGSLRLGMAPGYVEDPRVSGLFVPAGRGLRPGVRPAELRRRFDLRPDRVTWVEVGPDGRSEPHAVPVAAFRPLVGAVRYVVPAPIAFTRLPTADPFELPAFGIDIAEEVLPEPPHPPTRPTAPMTAADRGGLNRWLDRLAGRFRRPPPPPPAPALPQPAADRPPKPARLRSPAPTIDRSELEEQVLRGGPDATPAARAAAWVRLATAYGSDRDAADAAVCWRNAVWEAESPPVPWVHHWLAAECRAAGLAAPPDDLDDLLGESDRPGLVRAVAAAVCRAGGGHRSALPRLAAALDAQPDDLPARADWLARLALAGSAGGDPLGLARARDRLLARLRDRGPALDLDVPSFLRFHGTADPDRFRLARDWLVRSRGPVLDWVRRTARPGRLQWAGLDPEGEATPAYALLLLAWGLAALGERTRSKDWVTRAKNALARPPAPGADPAVHALLADAFAARVRDAQQGRPPSPGLPAHLRRGYDRLPEFGRYAVDKLRRHCRVLEPDDRVRDYGGKEFRDLWGGDRLGDRLALLAGLTDPAAAREEAARLLADLPGPADRPRVTFTLLDLASRLDGPTAGRLLGGVGDALDGLAEPKLRTRLIENAFAASARFGSAGEGRALAVELTHRATVDADLRADLGRAAGRVFPALARLDGRAEAAALAAVLDPGRGEWPADAVLPPHRVGVTAGWFAAGDEDAGIRRLDVARDRLFVAREGDDRDRTELAVAYTEALGSAPPRLALGRLEEMFQRLDGLAVTGSTNRYFTLQPLRLIDRAVGAVVPADAAPGPAARAWLEQDEDRTRRRIHRDMAAALRAEG